jgi:hypothetical protein
MIQNDPEIALALNTLADKLRARGKDELAYKLENLIELLIDELEASAKKKP